VLPQSLWVHREGRPNHQQVLSLPWVADHQFLARRAAESNAFSVPDRNALWSRAEDGLLVQAVAKYSTSNVLRREWSEVAWELPGRSEQQCKERYSLADTVVQLTFVFLRVIFRGSPAAFRSSHVLTKDADSADSARPLHYSKSDSSLARAPALSPCYSLTHAHRSIGYRNRNPQPLTDSAVRLMYLRVYDSRDSSRQPAPSPSLCYSLTHAHRSIGYRNRNPQPLAESAARLMYLRVYDSEVVYNDTRGHGQFKATRPESPERKEKDATNERSGFTALKCVVSPFFLTICTTLLNFNEIGRKGPQPLFSANLLHTRCYV
jgi:hypothetical protein